MKKRLLKKIMVNVNRCYINDILDLVDFTITRKKIFTKCNNGNTCYFWLKEFPLWKFGIILNEENKFEIFGEHEYMIDKFRPYYTYISFQQKELYFTIFDGKLTISSLTNFNNELQSILNKDEKHFEYFNDIKEVEEYMHKAYIYHQKQFKSITTFIKQFNKENSEINLKMVDWGYTTSPRYEIRCLTYQGNKLTLKSDEVYDLYLKISKAKYFNLNENEEVRCVDYMLLIGNYYKYIYTKDEFEYFNKIFNWNLNFEDHFK